MEKCPCCERMMYSVCRRRLNTSYEEEESNYLNSCLYCFADQYEYYAERWDEYYQGRI